MISGYFSGSFIHSCLFDPSTPTFSCTLCHSSPFAPTIIITVPRGHHPTINMNMSRAKLLVQMTYLTLFLMRMGQRTHVFCGHTVFKLQHCTWTRTEWKWFAYPRHTNTYPHCRHLSCLLCPRLMRLRPSPAQTLPLFPRSLLDEVTPFILWWGEVRPTFSLTTDRMATAADLKCLKERIFLFRLLPSFTPLVIMWNWCNLNLITKIRFRLV